MLRSDLVTAWRQMRRHAGQALINVLGLTAGIACCLLIFLFVRHETSFDAFHSRSDRIVRLNKVDTPEIGASEHHAVSSGLMGPTLVSDFPEVTAAVRLLPWFDDVVLTQDDVSIKVPNLVIADQNLFEVFDFRLLHGDPRSALEAPMSIVLTPRVAEALFPDRNPIGQLVTGLDNETYTVTGIVEEAPRTSHLVFDVLVSWSSTVPGEGRLAYHWMNNWLTQSLFTYLLLDRAEAVATLESRLPAFMRIHFAERAEQYHLYLQPLREVYLQSNHIQHARKVRAGNGTYVYIFSVVGALVLFIASVNFINLSTARAARRVREVGIRKALGATRGRLAVQFLFEALLVAFPATILAVVLVEMVLPSFNAFSGRIIGFEPTSLRWLIVFAATALILGTASGLYPAILQSGYAAARALKSDRPGRAGSSLPRRTLVVAQFTISISLLIGTAVVYRQMQFVGEKDLGFRAQHVVVMNTGGTAIERQYAAFTERIRSLPGLLQVAAARTIPGHGTMSFGLEPEGWPEDQALTAAVARIADPEMHSVLDLKVVKGRFFSRQHLSDLARGVVINEELARSLDWADPVGKRLDIQGELADGVVIGVVEDFHFESLYRPIDPLAIVMDTSRAGFVVARAAGINLGETIDALRGHWEAFEPRYPFEYAFLDERFGAFYDADRKLMQTLGLFSLLAVGIGCLGLWGLATFIVEDRTREIGIRKVLGASASRILVMMSRETVVLVVVSFALATPVTYLLAVRWLGHFVYRSEPSAGLFAAAGAVALLLASATVSHQALRAAFANPADVLRQE